MTWFRGVCQRERGDSVLEDIGEREQPALLAHNAAKVFCDACIISAVDIRAEAEDLVEKIVSVLFLIHLPQAFCICVLSESEGALRDVLAIIVVDGRSADAFVLAMLSVQNQKSGAKGHSLIDLRHARYLLRIVDSQGPVQY